MTKIFTVECLTNLHVGSGDSNSGVVDKEVERDEVTNYPVIYASSFKGALREHIHRKNQSIENSIFGDKKGGDTDQASRVKFFDAKLLATPLRASKGSQPYYMVTTPGMIQTFVTFLGLTGQNIAALSKEVDALRKVQSFACAFDGRSEEIAVEGTEITSYKQDLPEISALFKRLLPKESIFLVLSEADFAEVHRLPVRTRNKIGKDDNNLWFEEHVPYQSIFFTVFMETAEKGAEQAYQALLDFLAQNNVLQVGANASVGFGLVEVAPWEVENG